MSAKKIGKCGNSGGCCLEGPGCDGIVQKGCPEAEKIEKAHLDPCPAYLCGKCDIPKYRALVSGGKSCGDESGCQVRGILNGLIPVQDFEVSVKIPKSYSGSSLRPWEIKSVLKSYGK